MITTKNDLDITLCFYIINNLLFRTKIEILQYQVCLAIWAITEVNK